MTAKLQKYFVVTPIVYLFITIFLLRSKVSYVYLTSALLVALTIWLQREGRLNGLTVLARWLVVLAAIGISSSVILSIEKIELLIEPDHITSCSISPVVACSPVITSDQASAFGLPNPFIGIFGFAAVLTAGMTILSGASKLSKYWWRTLLGGIVFGAGFCTWLIYQALFNIGKLCLYCMLVWLVTFTLLWLVAGYCTQKKHLNLGRRLNRLLVYKGELIAATYAVILMLILYRWADYWFSLV